MGQFDKFFSILKSMGDGNQCGAVDSFCSGLRLLLQCVVWCSLAVR